MEYRIAKNNEELEAGLGIAYGSFPVSYSEMKNNQQRMRTVLPEDFNPTNIVLDVDQGQVIGMLRCCPRQLILGGVSRGYCFPTIVVLNHGYSCADRYWFAQNGVDVFSQKLILWPGRCRRVIEFYSAFGYVTCHSMLKFKLKKWLG